MGHDFDLTENGLLMAVHINRAGLSQQSRMLSHEAAHSHNANARKIATSVKKLDSEILSDNTSVVNRARKFFDTYSIPWMDSGLRYVPITNYPKVKQGLAKLQNEFEDSFSEIDRHYDSHKLAYLKEVNDIADEVPFPTREQLRSGFSFSWTEMALPNVDDIRLKHISKKDAVEIERNVKSQYEKILKNSQTEIVNRLKERVSHLKDKLDAEGGRIFASAVENIQEEVEIVKALNITDDPDINRIIKRIETELASIDVDAVKKNDTIRMEKSNVASSVLDDIKKSFGK